MSQNTPILDYDATQSSLSSKLTVEEGDDFIRVIFPVWPAWTYLIGPGISVLIGASKIAIALVITFEIWRLSRMGGQALAPAARTAMWHFMQNVFVPLLVMGLCWWLVALLEWRRYRRWGRVPRVLQAGKQGLSLTYLGWLGIRQKHWRADQIEAVELRPLRGNLTWWRPTADLIVRRVSKPRLKYRLSSSDADLPEHIAAKMRCLLLPPESGCLV